MKKIVSLFLCVLLICLSSVTVFAADIDMADESKTIFTIDGWTYSAVSGSSNLQVEQYNGSDTELYVPRIVNDRMVVAIVENCFSGNKTVKQVVTGSPLWTVGAYAFLNCTSIESFECNFALKEIGGGAFNGASSLKNINLEDSVVTVIRPLSFMSSGIENVTLPETCTKIDSYAFSQCNDLTKVTIPDSVTEIADNAFDGSENLVIYAKKDSYAIQYAIEHDIDYEYTDYRKVTYIRGDTDCDETVTIFDVTVIQRFLVGMIQDEDGMIALRGDVNEDDLDSSDETLIQRHLAHYDQPINIGEEVTALIPIE